MRWRRPRPEPVVATDLTEPFFEPFVVLESDPFIADVVALFTEPCADVEFAERLWGSLANVEWQKDGVGYGFTFRSAGGVIAQMRGEGRENYYRYYCCVQDGVVDAEVAELFATRGYLPETDSAEWLP